MGIKLGKALAHMLGCHGSARQPVLFYETMDYLIHGTTVRCSIADSV